MEKLKAALSNVLVQYIMKIGAGIIGTLGVSSGSVAEIVTAIVAFVLGVIGHWIQHDTDVKSNIVGKTALYPTPPENK